MRGIARGCAGPAAPKCAQCARPWLGPRPARRPGAAAGVAGAALSSSLPAPWWASRGKNEGSKIHAIPLVYSAACRRPGRKHVPRARSVRFGPDWTGRGEFQTSAALAGAGRGGWPGAQNATRDARRTPPSPRGGRGGKSFRGSTGSSQNVRPGAAYCYPRMG